MNPLRFKLLVAWNIVLSTAFLLLVLGVAVSTVQAANDPPVKIYTATLDHPSGIHGTHRTTPLTISGTGYQTILSIPVHFTGQTHQHHCLALGSAKVENTVNSGTGFLYDFAIKKDIAVLGDSIMTVEFSNNSGVNDPDFVPITTHSTVETLSPDQTHTFYFVAREQVTDNPNTVVRNASFTVICFKKLQT